MTDARMPERYLNDRRVARLSDASFRAFVYATMWSVSNRTDGVIHADDIPYVPHLTGERLGDLIHAGLAVRQEESWLLTDYLDTQTTKHELEVLANARRREREKKARQRANPKSTTPTFSDPVPGDVPGDVSPGTAQDRKARTTKPSEDEETASADAWDSIPIKQIPGSKGVAA